MTISNRKSQDEEGYDFFHAIKLCGIKNSRQCEIFYLEHQLLKSEEMDSVQDALSGLFSVLFCLQVREIFPILQRRGEELRRSRKIKF